MKKEHKIIINTLLAFVVCALALMVRSFFLQVVDRERLVTRYEGQTIRREVVYPNRGAIYDRNGAPLAISLKAYTLAVTPKQFKQSNARDEVFRQLSTIIPELKYEVISKKVRNRQGYTNLAKKLDLSEDQIEAIEKLAANVGGIHLDPAAKRLYPHNELLSQTLGFVGDDNIGLAGVEYAFNNELRGRATTIRYMRDNRGKTFGRTIEEPGENSQDLYLTIDKSIQAIAERALKDTVTESQANGGGVGVMDVQTGEILAIANYPNYDLTRAMKVPGELRKLPFVTDPFEPGSVFKIFTVASALENGIMTPESSIYCERGVFRVQGHLINEAETRKKYEWLTVKEIIAHSSNIGTTKIAFEVTYPHLKKTLEKFGFGQKTGIEIAGESRGIFTDKNNIPPLSLSNISFGQGVATTAIQILSAYAAIANGGVYHQPTIILGKKSEGRRVVSEKVANQLVDMLQSVVEEGTGVNARIAHFQMAGKTSTAQRPSPTGGYDGYVPGFAGFPVNVDDRFVIFAYVDNPKKGGYYGNTVAAPIFRQVAEYMLYKNKKYTKFAIEDAKESSTILNRVKEVAVRRYHGRDAAPNFVGLDKISAMQIAEKYDIKIQHVGMGIIKSQIPAAGTIIKSDSVIRLMYAPPQYE